MQRNGTKLLGVNFSKEFGQKSFREKLREHRRLKRESGTSLVRSHRFTRSLVLVQAPTQLYTLTQFVDPYVLGDYDSWTIHCIKVLCWYIMINSIANLLCVILYSPAIPKSRDRPDLARLGNRWDNLPSHFVPSIQEAVSKQDGSVVCDMKEKESLPWEFCEECKMHIPPRAHHCKVCKKCILKRDHHCYIVGNCIGFKNQRFFIVLAFYALGGVLFGFLQFKYLKDVYWPVAGGYIDFLLPVTIYRWLFRSIPGHVCLMVVHLYLDAIFCGLGWLYFSSQMTMAIDGLTLYEVKKKVPVKNTNSVSHNLRSVFGDFWGLNFIFPMVVILRQREDGVHWNGVKLYHTGSGKKWEDDGSML